MTPAEIAELERLARAATPGPWQDNDGTIFISDLAYGEICEASPPDAAYIAAAVNALPKLIEDWKRMREALIRCEEMVSTDKGPPDWDLVRAALGGS